MNEVYPTMGRIDRFESWIVEKCKPDDVGVVVGCVVAGAVVVAGMLEAFFPPPQPAAARTAGKTTARRGRRPFMS